MVAIIVPGLVQSRVQSFRNVSRNSCNIVFYLIVCCYDMGALLSQQVEEPSIDGLFHLRTIVDSIIASKCLI